MVVTENGKSVEISSVFFTENGKYVELAPAAVTVNGKYVELFGGKILVATIGTYSYVSDDNGLTWIQSSSQLPNELTRNCSATNGDTVVAVKGAGSTAYKMAVYTKDGLSWTIAESSPYLANTNGLRPVTYIPELGAFFLLKNYTDYLSEYVSRYYTQIYRSTDGITWNLWCSVVDSSPISYGLVYDAKRNLLLLPCIFSNDSAQTSYSKILQIAPEDVGSGSWVAQYISSNAHLGSGVAVNENGLEVAFVWTGSYSPFTYPLYRRAESVTWTQHSSPVCQNGGSHGYTIGYGNGRFVAVGIYTNAYSLYSTDGLNWTASFGITKAITNSSLKYDGEQFLCSAYDGTIYQSFDGITWSELKSGGGEGTIAYLT